MTIIRSIVLIALSALLTLAVAYAQSPYIGKHKNLFRVDQILVEGVKKVEPEAILNKVAVRRGMVVDNYLIRKDIQRIYQMKHFKLVEVHHRVRKGKNILIFKVQEKPIIDKIIIEGNNEIDQDDIMEQLKTKAFNILDINTLKNDVVTLQKFYEEKGFFLANVNFKVEKASKGTVRVYFKIQEFDKVRVKKITFLGNQQFSDKELKAVMATREESLFSPLSGSGNFKEFDFKTDLERIKYFYKIKGYLQINLASPDITVSPDKKWIFITIQIVEGPLYFINDISFNGELLFSDDKIMNKLSLKPGSRYAEDKLRDDIRTLTELYRDEGYAYANVLRNLEIVPGESKINLILSFEKGSITYFGKITIIGNTKTRDKVVRRELKIYEGMKYSGSQMRISKENVNRLGFFEPNSVVFNTSPNEKNSRILDVEVRVKERNTGQLSVGAGYSTAGGAFLQGSVAQNNFRGLGQNLRFTLQTSKNIRTFQLSFTEPYLADTKWSGGIDFFNDKNQTGIDQKVRNLGFTLRVGHPIMEFTRFFVAYKYVNTHVSDVDDPTIVESIENGPASIVEATVVRDTRNNRFEPSRGNYLSFSAEYAGLGFDKKWGKLEGEARYYRKIVGDLVLRYRFTVGQLYQVEGHPTPRSIKFFLGGPRNMRGHAPRKVGPQLQDEENPLRFFALGGRGKLYSTLEFEYPLAREAGLKWVVFTDAGNVYEKGFATSGGDFLRYDYGFGIRWFSPIGVLRFEVGYPIDKKPHEDSSHFFFDIGQLF